MHKETVDVYEKRGTQWAATRQPVRRADAQTFASRVAPGSIRIDLGCGAGRYLADLGDPVIGIDAARAMLEQCRTTAPGASLVEGDLELLPFGARVLAGGWANMSYLHVPSTRLPLALAELHRVLQVGAPIDLQVLLGDYEGSALPEDDVGGRYFASWQPEALLDVLAGAGFAVSHHDVDEYVIRVQAETELTLADTVGPDMRLLFVGLNPSLYSARAGVGFARPGNRFWPCALEAGVVDRDRDPFDALRSHAVGMTDVVKRPTTGAAELTTDEYRSGMARIERLARWLRPGVVCFVGLAGWRAAVDRHAAAGLQRVGLGGCPVYVMPSTSGANAHARPAELARHIEAAWAVGAHED